MKIAAVAILLTLGGISSADDPLGPRKMGWTKALDGMPFVIREADANALAALDQYTGDCRVHMVYDPKERGRMTFQFERDGKAVVSHQGHTGSVFRTEGNNLYFADFAPSASGCTVSAHDLTTGRERWRMTLAAVGKQVHSAYSNRVTVGFSRLPGVDKEGDGVVCITGRESYGDYVEILDRHSGVTLAHKVYRAGFAPIK